MTVRRTVSGQSVGWLYANPAIRRKRTLEELLLKLGLCDLDLDGLVDLLLVSPLVIGIVLDGRGEEGVDEGGLAEARFASNL